MTTKKLASITISYHLSFFLFLCILLIGGCKESPTYRIGISQCSTDDWRRKMNEEILREVMLLDNKVEVEIRSADDSSKKQIEDLQYFIDNDFDLIAVAPNEAEALTPIVTRIYDSGTPVIVFDRTVNGDSFTAFQGADNELIGNLAAKLAYSYSGENARILEIEGLKGSTPAEYRSKGFNETADSLGMKIVAKADGKWNFEDAVKATDSLVNLFPDIDIIYAHNDRMAIGASEVLSRRGIRDKVKIIGIDAAPTIGIKAVYDGTIDASFVYPTEGEGLISSALSILSGKEYKRINLLPTPSVVDRSNADILLLQNRALTHETDKIGDLKAKIDDYWKQHSIQTAVLYGAIIILILLALIIFLLLRAHWNGKRHHQEMERQNRELQRQRDELDHLYHQLEEATGSKLAWFTNVSHDLRTPLTLIADPVNQIVDAENLTAKQKIQMQLAAKNVKRLQRLVNQILDIRKFDNDQLKLNLSNTDVSESLKGWAESFSGLAVKRHIDLKIDIPEEEHIIAAIDIEKCERIMFNLLSNAFKFTPENGTITVSLRRDGNQSVIKVSDTGRGIPAEDINHIFERFFRTETVNPNGSGIGLALSKVFIDMHGGTIEVESEVDNGSTFIVKVPIRTVGEAAQTAVIAKSTIDTGEIEDIEEGIDEIKEETPAVLVIDDNRDICKLLKSVLGDDYTVVTASNGVQGIRLASKFIPDLIICDVMMPGSDGFEICRKLKKEELTAHIPVLLLTACALDEQRIEGYESGADAYMSKPFDSRMLLSRCRSLIENRNLIYRKKEDLTSNIESSTAQGESKSRDNSAKIYNAVEDDFIIRFTRVVEKEISNPDLSVESLADILGISRVQLYRKIKGLTNYSAAEMIRNIRLKKAAVMLKTTDSTVSEVAYAVGFSTPNYFTRCYKEWFGESPSDTHNRIYKGGK